MPVNRVNRDVGDDINALYKRVGLLERRGRGFAIPPAVDNGGVVASDNPPPAPSDQNTLWVDTNDGNKIYRWNGSAWVPTMDPAIDLDRNAAAVELASWQDDAAAADGFVTLYRQSAAPGASGLAVGDLWVDSDTNGLWRWSGSAWGDLGSTRLGALLAKPSLLSTVADGRVRTWWQYNPPTAEGFGDVWVNTASTPATLYRWNNYDWIQVLDWSVLDVQQQLETKVSTWYLPAAEIPTSTAVGDLWYDTSDNNHPYRAESVGATAVAAGQWVSVQDGDIAAAATAAGDALAAANSAMDAATTAQAMADGVITTHYSADPPWAAGSEQDPSAVGDLWLDTDTGQAYHWTGDDWLIVADNAVAEALLTAQNAQTTADGKINAYYLDDPPWNDGDGSHAGDTGDLWFDTDDQNKPHYWDGNSWEAIRDQAIIVAQQTAEAAISGYVTEYAVNSSETVAPTTGWSTATPTRTPGTFVWFRTTVTHGDGTSSTTSPALLTGNTGATGAAGAPAATVTLTATAQVLTAPAAGGATTPATSTVTGTAANTTITSWTYSVDGAAFSATVPAGVSRAGNTVTLTGGSMTARTIAIKAADANGVADTLTVARVSDGAAGSTGTAGADGYTIVLTNEAAVFPGDTTAALAGSTTSQVIAYKGATQVAATIGAITGAPAGMSTTIQNNGTTTAGFTVTVTSSLTTTQGTLTVPLTVDGKSFTKKFSWSLSLKGATGSQGIQGPAGPNGQTLYTWVKYADTPTSGMADAPDGKAYLGISYNNTSPTESTNYADYSWSLIEGPQGDQGIQGPAGADGTTTYTWVKYADDANGTGMADLPAGKTYLGLAYNKPTPTESSVATDYSWSLIQGPQGPSGANAATVTLTATSQVLSVPAGGGATTPATSTVTGTAVNTTISAWTYSVDGGAFSSSVPAGVSRAGNTVTVTGASMTAKTIAVKMADASGVADTLTVAKVADGATGAAGGSGPAGVGVTGTTVTYQVGTSGTTAPTGTWQTSPQSTSPGQYLWTRTVTNFSDSSSSTAYSVAAHGATGTNGVGVSSTVVTYQVGTSGTTAPTGTWVSTPQVAPAGQFLWTKTFTTYTDTSTSTAYSVAASGANGTNGTDGYTVMLTNEAQTIPAGTSAALAGTFTTDVIAYRGTAQQTASITQANITGLPAGMTAAVTNSGTTSPRVTFTVTTSLTAPSGQITIPVVVGGITFNQVWSYALSYTGAAGTNAEVINLSGTTQVLSVPAAGGATTPATAVISGTAINTTIGYYEYKVDGGTFGTGLPTGVTISGNDVTVTGSTFTGKTLTVRMSKSNGSPINDTFTVAKVADGAAGGDGYTVLLTNEASVFPGTASAAVAGSTTSQVLAYKGGTQIAATIGTITGQVTGLTTTIQNNGTTTAGFTVTVTAALTQQSGTLTVPLTVDGKSFTKTFAWSVSYTGSAGLVWKAWSPATTYAVNDAVTYGGSSYRRIVAGGAPTGTPTSAFDTFTPPLTATGSVYSRGNRLRVTAGGTISAVRFWRGAGAPTSRTVRLYNGAGTLLASKVTSEAAAPTGWFTVTLDSPVAVAANDEIVPTYDAPATETIQYATSGFSSDTPLIAYVWGQYASGAGVYPSTNNPGVFYAADVVFNPASTPDADTTNWTPLAQQGSAGTGVTSVTPYFAQVASGSAAPAKPGNVATPPAPWVATEPAYAASTDLYRTDRVAYSDGTYAYTTVTLASAYTAATQAMATASAKARVFREPRASDSPLRPASSPALGAGDVGDLWYDTSPGPGPAWDVITAQLTSNVATLTTSDPHDIAAGNTVVVQNVGTPFDGSYTVSSVTVDTVNGVYNVKYSVTSADVASTPVDGTVQAQGTGAPVNHAYVWNGSAWDDAQDAEVISTVSTVNEQSLTLAGHTTDIDSIQRNQTTLEATAYAADGRISISDYTPTAADVSNKNEGSLWITRTRDRLNVCTNPNFEYGVAGWAGSSATIAQVSNGYPAEEQPGGGTKSLRVTNTGANGRATWAGGSPGIPVQVGQQWIVSGNLRLVSGAGTGAYAEVQFYDAAGVPLGAPVAGAPMDLVTTTYDRPFVSVTAPPGAAYMRGASFVVPTSGAVWDLDGVLVEATNKLGKYFDGDTDEGGSWTDPANPGNSTSELDGGAVIRLFELADGGWAEKWWSKDTISSVYAGAVVGGPGYKRDAALPVNALDGGLVADSTLAVDKLYAQTVVCGEPVSAGDLVNVYDNSGLFMVRPATARTANAVPNPSMETDTSSYTASAVTLARSNAWAADGSYSLQLTPTAASSDSFASIVADSGAMRLGMQAGHTYTASATIRLSAAQGGTLDSRARRILIYWVAGGVTYSAQSDQAPNVAAATRLTVTAALPTNTTSAWVRLYNGSNSASAVVWWDAVQVTESAAAMEYFEGATVREASGFVLEAGAVGTPVRVYHQGYNELLSGMAPGPQFLSTVPGDAASAPPTAVGALVQRVGFAAAASVLDFSTAPTVLIV